MGPSPQVPIYSDAPGKVWDISACKVSCRPYVCCLAPFIQTPVHIALNSSILFKKDHFHLNLIPFSTIVVQKEFQYYKMVSMTSICSKSETRWQDSKTTTSVAEKHGSMSCAALQYTTKEYMLQLLYTVNSNFKYSKLLNWKLHLIKTCHILG